MPKLLKMKLKSYELIIIVGLILFLFTILFGFLLFSPMLRAGVKSQKALKNGNEMRDLYLKLPIPLDFRVYFFNISNPQEVQEGQKPILKEIGPYCYDAYKEKIVVNENKEQDTLTYSPYDTYYFNQSRTGELSEDDYVTILNPLTVGIINTVANQSPRFLSAVNKALDIILKESNTLYLTTKVRDILFEGIMIDCNVKDFGATAMCSQFKGQPAMRQAENNVFYFSIFGSRNGSISQQITVHRGIKSGANLGQVVAIDNQTDLNIWQEQQCNVYLGTDGWIFPSFLQGDIYIVASDLCRNFKARYIENIKFHKIKVKKYFADLDDFTNQNGTCYCQKIGQCLPKGVMDLTKCLKVPLYCTLPHFLYADEKLLEQVDGLQPEVEKHVIKIYFEPITGTPMLGQRRIQFNLEIKPLRQVVLMQSVPEALHPILWLEEGVELEGYLLSKVVTVVNLLRLVLIGRYIFLVVCLQLVGYGCYRAYKERKLSHVFPAEKTFNKEIETDTNELEQENQDPNFLNSTNIKQ